MSTYGTGYWASRTPATSRRKHPRLTGNHTSDVVVIGGGLTGCAAAFALSAAGHSVILVEAERLAMGGTSCGLGAILPVPDTGFRVVEAASGRRVATIAWQETRRAATDFGATLKRANVRCDLESTSLVINAPFTQDAAELRREQAALKAAGTAAPWLSAAAARAALATQTEGALKLSSAFTFDPAKAALALASAASASGARLFEGSRVTRTTFTRKDATVSIGAAAKIRTRLVFVATGEPGALYGQLRRHVRRRTGYFVVTEPLTAAMRREVGERSAVLTEGTEAPRWLRWLPGHRALFGGAVSPPVPDRLRDRALVQRSGQLMYELSVRYPVISGLPLGAGWDVPVVSTLDGLPWIGAHRNYPHHFFALALGWHGEALSWLAARAAVRHLAGEKWPAEPALGFLRHL